MSSSPKRINGVLAISLCAAMFAGCSGGGVGRSAMQPQSQSPVLTTQSTQSTQAAKGNVSFAIGIRPKTKTGRITPKYVSPSTRSLRILTDDANPVGVNLTRYSPNCSPNPTVPGAYTCTASLSVPAGNHVFTVTTYEWTGCNGSILSTNSTGTVYVKPTGTTTVSIVLEGVVHYVILTLATTNPPVGPAATIGLTAILEDTGHNLIIGTASYKYPVTLTTTDSSNSPLSRTVLQSPADTSGIMANYNGANVASITYSATAPGLQSADVSNAFLTPGGPTITEYAIPGGAGLWGIADGPDGALWFTDISGKIGRITTGGSASEYPIPTPRSNPEGISPGPDGALWFTELYAGKVGRITTDGRITEYTDTLCAFHCANSGGQFSIVSGSDGALWLTEEFGGIGRITTSGSITAYSLPYRDSFEGGIAAGPDGALWFTEPGNPDSVLEGLVAKIGRITTGGSYAEYPIPTTQGWPYGITAGKDGALWFTESSGNKIGRITIGGQITEYSIPTAGSSPNGVAAGPDGALWFTESSANKIGRITTGGQITEYPLPTARSSPYGITAGPDGVWFTEYSAGNCQGVWRQQFWKSCCC